MVGRRALRGAGLGCHFNMNIKQYTAYENSHDKLGSSFLAFVELQWEQ